MAINPRATSQFDKDGAFSQPYLALDFACQGCHNEDGRAENLSDEELQEAAIGFHDREEAGSLNKRVVGPILKNRPSAQVPDTGRNLIV